MKESLEQFVDDYIESVLAVIDALHTGDAVDHISLHESLAGRIEAARQSHHHDGDWEAAIYALVALTDELMLEMPWSGRIWWNDHVLEASVFGSRVCSERFYQLAAEASRDSSSHGRVTSGQVSGGPSGGVLRVFYDCVLLGFRGVYSVPGLSASTTNALGIPPTIEDWLARTQHYLADDSTAGEPARQHRQLSGASPNALRRNIVWWTVAAGVMLIANIAVFSLTRHS
ncbi:DotU family type IV/VI secretion system protein [Rubripirellula reticaptiva]|uniref:Type IV / VI secretion system DotU domain-containing protein n=1 Tax=Rubripirellula reticaptiva TaxID=2528013 RepID=A0A5C6F736_9BACT|nr:DotU family type IV/VI secretion system protein [Rubripirellula reticaptiva]TWU56294.1 hypothetical protein Poly59_25980 [Rubripirellula reticaptiva]